MIQNKIVACICMMVIVFSNTSCVVSRLWKKPLYKEELSQFYVSQDGNMLIFLGQNYHYIFPIDARLKHILAFPRQHMFELHLKQFTMQENNQIDGGYLLEVRKKHITPAEEIWLKNNHFQSFAQHFSYDGSLSGRRYLATTLPAHVTSHSLTRPDTVYIEDNFTDSQKASNILLTPLAVLGDGTLAVMVGGVATAVTPVVLFNRVKNNYPD